MILSSLSPDIHQALVRNGIDFANDPVVASERDLDHALERCEERLLSAISREETWQDVEDYLAQTIGPSTRLKDLVASMQEIRLQPGDRFIRAGEPATISSCSGPVVPRSRPCSAMASGSV